jgi:hypothetical protein
LLLRQPPRVRKCSVTQMEAAGGAARLALPPSSEAIGKS